MGPGVETPAILKCSCGTKPRLSTAPKTGRFWIPVHLLAQIHLVFFHYFHDFFDHHQFSLRNFPDANLSYPTKIFTFLIDQSGASMSR